MYLINIITRCTRPNNLLQLRESIYANLSLNIKFNWIICFDSRILKDLDVELLAELQNKSKINVSFKFLEGDYWGLKQLNDIFLDIESGWIYHLDDDNLLYSEFSENIETHLNNILMNSSKITQVIVFSQKVDFKDFANIDIRIAKPENMKVSKVDLAQWMVDVDIHKQGYLYGSGYTADGEFIENLYNERHELFFFIEDVLCYYNKLQKDSKANVPKVLLISKEELELTTIQNASYESNELNVLHLEDDNGIQLQLAKFKPDVIVTYGDDGWEKYKNLSSLSYFFRKKWIHFTSKDKEFIGTYAYNCAMENILFQANLKEDELISYITPVYNTGEKIINTYRTLLEQTYTNWEWVLVNDSTDGGKTLKIIEELAKNDPRLVIYDFREKSKGNIGDVKYKGFMLAKGYLLAELDHDDWLVPDCTQQLYMASKKHPECGFFYNDTAEVTEDFGELRYPDGFAFGYGKYREDEYKGMKISTIAQQNINPKTIRHIVGVPNHVRAWKRDVYLKIGGHARGLAIADDYELLVRTFLETRFCKIPKLGYIQFIYNNPNGRNTHDLSRADIQRRVATIANYYNERIYNRFKELGLIDWAYEENPSNPLNVESRFGEEENYANIIYND